jgi:hypothetical protein
MFLEEKNFWVTAKIISPKILLITVAATTKFPQIATSKFPLTFPG